MDPRPPQNIDQSYDPEGEPTQDQIQDFLAAMTELVAKEKIMKMPPGTDAETTQMLERELAEGMSVIVSIFTQPEQATSTEEELIIGQLTLVTKVEGGEIERNWFVESSNVPGYYSITHMTSSLSENVKERFKNFLAILAKGTDQEKGIEALLAEDDGIQELKQKHMKQLMNFLATLKEKK